jgi:predicted enzyme related to lactoylglutathione lyase
MTVSHKQAKRSLHLKEKIMKFASTRLVAADIKKMVAFYELVTDYSAEWLAPVFAEIVTPGATLAIGSAETVALFKEGSAQPGVNKTAILEFMVPDVDAEFARLKNQVEVVHEPKDLPWGNRTVQFSDPEGTRVALYTPVTEAAIRRFSGR